MNEEEVKIEMGEEEMEMVNFLFYDPGGLLKVTIDSSKSLKFGDAYLFACHLFLPHC